MSTELSSDGKIKPNGEFIDIALSPLPQLNLDIVIENDKSFPITLFSQAEPEKMGQFTEISFVPEKKIDLGWSSAVMSRRRQQRQRFRRR